ncbi:MAG TPA: ATP phosphoribosyltransferase, partial [Ochrobactrum intermedium]|nr:ATP phosphoribosyltransferase [Brucella intermedia]
DITSTGSTLRANRLKVLEDGIILRSQACLVSARRSRENARVMDVATRIRNGLTS